MRLSITLLLAWIAVFGQPTYCTAVVLTFDDLAPLPADGTSAQIPNGYRGLNWSSVVETVTFYVRYAATYYFVWII